MFIKLACLYSGAWDYEICTGNRHAVLKATNSWTNKSACIRAAKKMARRLGIEYREVK